MRNALRAVALALCCAAAVASGQEAAIQIDASRDLGAIDPLLYGINTARWDESLFPGPDSDMLLSCDRDAVAKIKASGVTLLKYPGGNDADAYIWNSTQNDPAEMSTDEYMALCRETGAEPFITINFNAPASLAADWVRSCKERGYRVRFWEVGDEQWGTWAKGHSSPEVYAEKYISFVKAMRAVDPEIKVATNVPLGPHPEQWTTRVLKAARDYIDMLTVTYYPQQWGKENDDSLLASTAQYRRLFADLRHEVAAVLGEARAAQILYVNVGYNSVNHSPGPQTVQMVNAVWVADMLGAMAETGTNIACYWAVHNAFPPRGGDYGYLSSEGSNTPRPAYHVFPLFTRHFAGRLAGVACSDPALSVYASRRGKLLTLMVINKVRTQSRTFAATMQGFVPRDEVRRWMLDAQHEGTELAPVQVRGGRLVTEVPPYSVTAFEIVARDSTDPPANLALQARASASSFSTIGPHFGPRSAIDGVPWTRWCSAAWTKSNGQEEQWLCLAWPAPQRLSYIRITWGESPASSYRVETSQDSLTWDLAARVPQGRGGTERLEVAPRTARYLRIWGERGTKGISAYAIREIAVYASRPPEMP